MTTRARIALLLVATLLSGCGSESETPLQEASITPTTTTLKAAGHDVRAELALDGPARNHGLMFRTRLGDDDGMLFVFPDDQPLHFYMRNTFIPLDIVFLRADGTVINVTHGTPSVEIPTCDSDGPARLVLELNAGWCSKNGLKPGDRVQVPPEILPLGR